MLRNKFYITFFLIVLFFSNILSQIDSETYKKINQIAEETEKKMLNLPDYEKKINSLILDKVNEMIADDVKNNYSGKLVSDRYSSKSLKVDEQGCIKVKIMLFKNSSLTILDGLVSDLKKYNVEILNRYYPSSDVNWFPEIVCFIPYFEVKDIAKDKRIASITISPDPIIRIGSKTTEGDEQLYAQLARNVNGVDGTGVKVGVISDGIQGYENSQASGDLPYSLSWISGHNNISGSEGRTMLEIVYDLAPGSSLMFGSAFYGGADPDEMMNTIGDLVSFGCKVIVDDIGWMNDPWFEDGALSQSITNYINHDDVTYISAAGNDGLSMWTGDFHNDGSGWNDYYHQGSTPNIQNWITVPDEDTVYIYLQWQDTWGDAANNYDLYVFDEFGQQVGQGGHTIQGTGNNEAPI